MVIFSGGSYKHDPAVLMRNLSIFAALAFSATALYIIFSNAKKQRTKNEPFATPPDDDHDDEDYSEEIQITAGGEIQIAAGEEIRDAIVMVKENLETILHAADKINMAAGQLNLYIKNDKSSTSLGSPATPQCTCQPPRPCRASSPIASTTSRSLGVDTQALPCCQIACVPMSARSSSPCFSKLDERAQLCDASTCTTSSQKDSERICKADERSMSAGEEIGCICGNLTENSQSRGRGDADGQCFEGYIHGRFTDQHCCKLQEGIVGRRAQSVIRKRGGGGHRGGFEEKLISEERHADNKPSDDDGGHVQSWIGEARESKSCEKRMEEDTTCDSVNVERYISHGFRDCRPKANCEAYTQTLVKGKQNKEEGTITSWLELRRAAESTLPICPPPIQLLKKSTCDEVVSPHFALRLREPDVHNMKNDAFKSPSSRSFTCEKQEEESKSNFMPCCRVLEPARVMRSPPKCPEVKVREMRGPPKSHEARVREMITPPKSPESRRWKKVPLPAEYSDFLESRPSTSSSSFRLHIRTVYPESHDGENQRTCCMGLHFETRAQRMWSAGDNCLPNQMLVNFVLTTTIDRSALPVTARLVYPMQIDSAADLSRESYPAKPVFLCQDSTASLSAQLACLRRQLQSFNAENAHKRNAVQCPTQIDGRHTQKKQEISCFQAQQIFQKKKVQWTPSTVEPLGNNQDYCRRSTQLLHRIPFQEHPVTSYAYERPRLQSEAAKGTITHRREAVHNPKYHFLRVGS